jgi:hypothetical protein
MRNEREQVQKFVLVDAHTAFCCYIRGHSGIVEVLLGRQQVCAQIYPSEKWKQGRLLRAGAHAG